MVIIVSDNSVKINKEVVECQSSLYLLLFYVRRAHVENH